MSASVVAGLLGVGVLLGAAVGGGSAVVARRLAVARGFRPRHPARGLFLRTEPAAAVGAVIPLAAWVAAPGTAATVVVTGLGWLLLAIAICDERSLSIPHVLWLAGAAVGFWLAWRGGGWPAVLARAYGVGVLEGALVAGAGLASIRGRRAAIGSADFGVAAFVGAVFGPVVAGDVFLVAAVLALGTVASDAAPAQRRVRTSVLTSGAVVVSLFGGLAGAVVSSIALACSIAVDARRGRAPGAAPFGACLAAASICIALVIAVLPECVPAAARADVVLHHLLAE